MIGKACNFFKQGVFSASHVILGLGMLSLIGLVIVSVADVFLRRFFNAPLRGAAELTQVSLSVVVFGSLAYCAMRNAHVAVDVITARFRQGAQRVLRIGTHFLSIVILGIISWQLFTYAAKMQEVGKMTVMLEISVYPFVFAAAVGTALLGLVFLVQFCQYLAGGKLE
jgi:TRAP-type C4-dicarboxylate transport system permease small subunit